jgi:type IX secretion system substrate protein/META domain-containing protein
MKRLLILILLFSIGSSVNAQDPDPDLFQTWYLQDIVLEFGPPLHLLDPPVYPFLVISENLEYSGQGSCNTFTGTYVYDPINDTMESVEFTRTNIDCVFPYHNQFETQYFTTVRGWLLYEISDDGVGLQLHIYHPFPEISATFTNYSLTAPDIKIVEIAIYPNPSHSEIFIESQNDPITKIELFNLLGESVQSLTDNTGSIDISDLAVGVYLLRVITEQGSTVKKIIKQ